MPMKDGATPGDAGKRIGVSDRSAQTWRMRKGGKSPIDDIMEEAKGSRGRGDASGARSSTPSRLDGHTSLARTHGKEAIVRRHQN